ncbi:AFR094Cp [Eremothecium gossypii ATCC 10895]|uniref:GPI-anchored wall transfer protein 1 n=1 Tax=Eremothecium gossypii (strain ATCC 10895 / CBS 109.51 / FGSC 9923 / NRRL Y-1056) TaxID=284811 RepID=GWT1_EREGS|nr:AFR094Cp [Eremothecium gossypii ATCC 10895]Q754I2.1 RecName: Full=GPI-anchored wall transfer protein 1 [Eremothecium gossypii ATCC 10895]AAS53465.1 AFR094Cp [Eremothecium gossypii ATCC 10895]AEY97777.1 FAFR094Cp [Eremothecium gossypii FDAG1]
MNALKERKEAFVSGLEGGSIAEINLVTTVALTAYFGWQLLNRRLDSVPLVVDFLLNWAGLLLSITVYANDPVLLNLLIAVPCIVQLQILGRSSQRKTQPQKGKESARLGLDRKPFITAYRGGMLIITCLAILAVDFPVFPRRFAKVETWGTSLMDLGVGSFVFSNGLVAASALLKQEISGQRPPLWSRLVSSVRSAGILLALGVARLVSVKGLEYQEHVTEYGTSWNFFFTLALVPLAMILVDPICTYVPRVFIALLLSVFSEYLLQKEGFLQFMIMSKRDNFFNSNREGILSFLGYCAIFLLGQNTGFYVLGNRPTVNNLYRPSGQSWQQNRRQRLSAWDKWTSVTPLAGLLAWFFITVALFQLTMAYHPYTVSRRFANLPYVLWVAAYNLGFLSMYCMVDSLFNLSQHSNNVPVTLDAVNSNGLFVFLLANCLTGLINMNMNTLDSTLTVQIAALFGYATVIASVAIIMYKCRIFIKL